MLLRLLFLVSSWNSANEKRGAQKWQEEAETTDRGHRQTGSGPQPKTRGGVEATNIWHKGKCCLFWSVRSVARLLLWALADSNIKTCGCLINNPNLVHGFSTPWGKISPGAEAMLFMSTGAKLDVKEKNSEVILKMFLSLFLASPGLNSLALSRWTGC